MMAGTQRFTPQELADRIEQILAKAGFNKLQAGGMARVLAAAERDHCKSHGIYRLDGCLKTLKAGKVNPGATPVVHHDDSAIVRVDAQSGFAFAALEAGRDAFVERTRKLGMASMVINDCTHLSALWPEVEVLTDAGLAAIAMCPSYATVAPFGGSKPLLGTNPFAFGWPRPDKAPYVFDFATSMAARGEIELHRKAGKTLPEGWAIDADGNPTTDPDAALDGAMLPFGAHKGSAISTMVELLSGVLIGDLTSPEVLESLGTTTLAPHHGELIIAFSPERFMGGREGSGPHRAETLLDAIAGQGARLPSQRRFAARAKTAEEGIELTAEEVAHLDHLLATV